ncbi:MAG TPA: AsmA family protein [Burkholderiaceae bacterium]|jgi:AsmA protein|nr:AsmA family protein [Burkholderiaceae bacterium]
MLKKIAIGVGALIGVLVLALVAFAAFFDANKFKPEIEQYVRDKTRRTLKFEGDLSLSLFPRIALAAPRTTLSNLAGDRVSASLDSAKVSVALLPLVRGRIEVGTVAIDGLTATIERRRDGSTSIDDLIRPGDGAGGEPAAASAIAVGGIELTNADLTLNDLAANRTVRLSKLNLKTGPLAAVARSALQLDAQFDVSDPPAAGSVKLASALDLDLPQRRFAAAALDASVKATVDKQPLELSVLAERVGFLVATGGLEATRLDVKAKGAFAPVVLDDGRLLAPALAFDPAAKRLSIGGLEARAKGKFSADAFEVTLAAPKLDITETAASGQRASVKLKLAGARPEALAGDFELTLEGLSGNAREIAVAQLALAADARLGARKFVAALAGPVAASLDKRTLSIARFAGDVTMEDPALPAKSVKLPLTARLAIDAQAERIDAGFSAKFDDTNAAAEFAVRGFQEPRITFDASADRLDVDRYFPPPPPRPGNDSADPKDDPPVDLSALGNLNLSGQVKLGHLRARGLKASNVDIGVRAAKGKLELVPVNAQLYGGTLAGRATLAADGNRIALDAALSQVAIGPLAQDLLDNDLLEGRGNVMLAVTTAGGTVGAFKRALAGTARLQLRDGAIRGINLAAQLRGARALLAGGSTDALRANAAEKTDFSELAATFTIKDGVAVNDDLQIKSPLLRISGAGRIDVAAGTIDYATRVAVVGTLKGQDGRPVTELRGVAVPVKLAGPFEKLAWNLDWSEAAKEALKSQLAGKAEEKLKDKARDALKGLLQR